MHQRAHLKLHTPYLEGLQLHNSGLLAVHTNLPDVTSTRMKVDVPASRLPIDSPTRFRVNNPTTRLVVEHD